MLRGLLQDIDILASEVDVRRNCWCDCKLGEEFSSCSRHSFEYIEATESGQVYVCLLYDPESSSESDDLPAIFLQAPITSKSSAMIEEDEPYITFTVYSTGNKAYICKCNAKRGYCPSQKHRSCGTCMHAYSMYMYNHIGVLTTLSSTTRN